MTATYSGPVTLAVNCKTTIALSMMVYFLETVGIPAAHSLGHHSQQQELHPRKLPIVHTHTQTNYNNNGLLTVYPPNGSLPVKNYNIKWKTVI